jgi:hypothetical protein
MPGQIFDVQIVAQVASECDGGTAPPPGSRKSAKPAIPTQVLLLDEPDHQAPLRSRAEPVTDHKVERIAENARIRLVELE